MANGLVKHKSYAIKLLVTMLVKISPFHSYYEELTSNFFYTQKLCSTFFVVYTFNIVGKSSSADPVEHK